MLLIDNPQFSQFLENGIVDLAVHLNISDSDSWPIGEMRLNLSWPCLRKNQRIVIQSFGDLSGDLEKFTNWYDTFLLTAALYEQTSSQRSSQLARSLFLPTIGLNFVCLTVFFHFSSGYSCQVILKFCVELWALLAVTWQL